MSINAVTSFRGQNLETLVAGEPAFVIDARAGQSSSPIASSPIQDSYVKSGSSVGKKVAWTAVILAAVATTLGLLHGKTEMFGKELAKLEWNNLPSIADKAKWVVAKSGEFVNEYASKAWNSITKLFQKSEKAAE